MIWVGGTSMGGQVIAPHTCTVQYTQSLAVGYTILHTFAESTQCGPVLPWKPVPSWTCP